MDYIKFRLLAVQLQGEKKKKMLRVDDSLAQVAAKGAMAVVVLGQSIALRQR